MISKYIHSAENIFVNIDTTGIGIQLGQDLDDHYYYKDNVEINEINFSHKAMKQRQYSNIFTEMFFSLSEQIDKISLIDDPDMNQELEVDLGSRKYGFDPRMRYLAEKKKEWIKRFKRSPDMGDSVLLAFYDRRGWSELQEKYYEDEEKKYRKEEGWL